MGPHHEELVQSDSPSGTPHCRDSPWLMSQSQFPAKAPLCPCPTGPTLPEPPVGPVTPSLQAGVTLGTALSPSPAPLRLQGLQLHVAPAHGHFSWGASLGDGLLLFPRSHLFLAPELS